MKILKVLVYLAIYYTAIDLLIFYFFVLRAWNKLGYLPYYNNPDPQDLGFNKHYNIAYYWSGELLPYCWGILLICGIACLIKKKNILQINKWHFIVFGLLTFIEILTFLSPLFEWFVD